MGGGGRRGRGVTKRGVLFGSNIAMFFDSVVDIYIQTRKLCARLRVLLWFWLWFLFVCLFVVAVVVLLWWFLFCLFVAF